VTLERSSWVAARRLPPRHTPPGGAPVGTAAGGRSRRSAAWMLRAVDICWGAKQERIRPAEREAARAAYGEAKTFYERILAESPSK
jgi:hypothetical protein